VLEDFLKLNAKRLRNQKGQLKRWVVFALFQRNDGLPSDSNTIRESLLSHLAGAES
jgi:hypothetical protein